MFTLEKASVLGLGLMLASRSQDLQKQYDNSFMIGQIIGIIVLLGGLAFVVLIVWLVIKALRKKNKNSGDQN